MALTLTQRARSRIALVSGVLLVLALGAAQFAAPVGTVWRDVALVAASVLAGFPIAVRAWAALRHMAFSIDLLVTVAVVGALIIGEYVESAVVSFLFLFGAWLEARSLERTRASLRELVDLAPTRATVIRDDERVTVDAEDVEVGETVIVTSGERIAVDGIVASGTASVTEASITGESVPVRKEPGNRVFAGTVAEAGYLEAVERPFATADRLRTALMAGILVESLERRFGTTWWRAPDASSLVDAVGAAKTDGDVLAQLGYDALDWRPVMRQIRTRLIGEMSGYGGPNITTRAGTRKV